jgi:hypothetical protein
MFRRVSIATVALGVLVAAIVLLGSSGASSQHGPSPSTNQNSVSGSSHLTTVTDSATAVTGSSSGGPVTTLPPSRDNDAGRSRIVDQYPDADVDSYQRKP